MPSPSSSVVSPPPPLGKIITFYSYKGGTGRSMAVANIACLIGKSLARTSKRVLVMDWDLEAPGLHRFFSAKSDMPEYEAKPGVINYFHSLRQLLTDQPGLYERIAAPEGWQVLDKILSLEEHCIPDVVQGVDFMPAGRFGPGYGKLVGSFNWIEFFDNFGAVIPAFRDLLGEKFTYTLVDSRTGLTDVSGICTTLLPEKLVGVFTPNRQSLSGLCDLVKETLEYRGKSDDFRPLAVFPLPSRVENAEQDLKTQWRSAHETDRCDLTAYFNDVLLPHASYYAYGENIAVLQDRQDAISLAAAYQRFFDRLMNSDFAWEIAGADLEVGPTQVSPAPLVGDKTLSAPPPTEKYDAFLSYATSDEKVVAQVDAQLRRYGVKAFFPFRDLAPGEDLAAGTAAAMGASKAMVVFVGEAGIDPRQNQESLAALENYAKDPTKRIIPVLLPKAPGVEKLRIPNFLRNYNLIDLRSGVKDEQAIATFAWALTGERRKPKKDLMWWSRAGVAGVAVGLALFFGTRWLMYKGYVGEIATYSKAVAANPNDADAHASLGDALLGWGRTDEAIHEYIRALTLTPDSLIVNMNLEEAVDKLSRDRAISVIREAIGKIPNDARLHSKLSEELGYKGDLDGAISEMAVAVKLDPSGWMNHGNLAALMEEKGEPGIALDEYRAASALNPPDYFADEYSDAIKRLSSQVKTEVRAETYAWGIAFSADKPLSGATYEAQLALGNGLSNVALYRRPKWYRTVVRFKDKPGATAALATIESKLNARWKGAYVVQVDTWCSDAKPSTSVKIDDHEIPLFECPKAAGTLPSPNGAKLPKPSGPSSNPSTSASTGGSSGTSSTSAQPTSVTLVVLYLSESEAQNANQIADILKANAKYADVSVRSYDPQSVIWKSMQPAELHYFKSGDRQKAEDVAQHLGEKGIKVLVRFMNAEAPDPGYLEIWLRDQ
jgi:tetratricopeptide (TPR) repeat protein